MLGAFFAAAMLVPELELQAGYLTDGATSAPAAALRTGVDLNDLFSVSLHFTDAVGSPLDHASGASPNLDPSGFRAWRMLLEVRLHSRGPLQLHVAGAAGIAQLSDWQCNCNEVEWLHGKPAFSARAAAGVRWLWNGGLTFSTELEVSRWSGLKLDPSIPAYVQSQPASHITYGLLAGIGYRWH